MTNKSGRTNRPLCQVLFKKKDRALGGAGASGAGIKARNAFKKKIPPHHF
jgi:hypothetical protein